MFKILILLRAVSRYYTTNLEGCMCEVMYKIQSLFLESSVFYEVNKLSALKPISYLAKVWNVFIGDLNGVFWIVFGW